MKNNPYPNAASRTFLWFLGAGIVIQFWATPAFAQDAGTKPRPSPSVSPSASPTPSPSVTPSPTPTPLPKVSKVTGLIALHEILEVDCDWLKEWAQTKTNDPSKLVLYLDGTPMKGLIPKVDKANANQLFFKLERLSGNDESKADNSKAWDALFSRPKGLGKNGLVRVTVGTETGLPFESDQTAFLFAINPSWFNWYILGVLGLFIGMLALAWKSDLLRDSGPPPPAGRKPYSLARTQMAFWFFLIVAAYGFIFMVTGATDTVTASVLGLMGISAGTGLAAVAVDNSKRAQAQTELDKLRSEQAKLQGQQMAVAAAAGIAFSPESLQRLNALTGLIAAEQANPTLDRLKAEQAKLQGQQQAATSGGPAFSPEDLQRLNALTGLIAAEQANPTLDRLKAEQAKLEGQQQAAATATGPGFQLENLQRLTDLRGLIVAQQAIVNPVIGSWFIQDILSDADAISFHRLQIAVWTVVLGIIFGVSVYNVLSMPTFSATLLGLMGISGGTYIGFKIPENMGSSASP